MRVIYIADDDKEFNNEFDCKDYEWKLAHPHLSDVRFYDEHGKELHDKFSEGTYNLTEMVIVPTHEALMDLQALSEYCGFYCYEDITEIGVWKFHNNNAKFIYVSDS